MKVSAVVAAASASPPMSYLGRELDGRYRLERVIGEGASAWVFAAQDRRLERDVAVKLLKLPWDAERASQLRRCVAEGRTLAKLVHPHVVLVYDAGETADGLGYLVTELSTAGNLEDTLVRRGKLTIEDAMRLLVPIVGALACAHDRGIVHRDIKPANLAVLGDGGDIRVKVLDFGIARLDDSGASTASVRGTPSYMAPEQARGEALSAAVDIWSLGVVFFRCLSGAVPFEGASPLETLLKVVQGRAPRFADACPHLSPHVALALDRTLEPNLRRRYSDMRSFGRALAVACARDGVALPRQPEPIGLPDFERWAAGVELESTHRLESEDHAGLTPQPARWRHAALRRARAAVALGVIGASAWTATLIYDGASGKARETSPTAYVTAAPKASVAGAARAAPVPTATLTAPAPVPALPSTPQAPKRSRVKAKLAAGRTGPSPRIGVGESGPASSPARERLIKNWEW